MLAAGARNLLPGMHERVPGALSAARRMEGSMSAPLPEESLPASLFFALRGRLTPPINAKAALTRPRFKRGSRKDSTMQTIHHIPDRRERDHLLAVSAFVAGLPDFRRGRIVTSSSQPDAWRSKHPAIQRRLAAARQLREVRA